MNEASIQDLAVNPNTKITPMVIKSLVDIINQEFGRQQTLYDTEAEFKREEILKQYQTACGYEALKKSHDKAKEQVEKAQKVVTETEKKLHLKGLDPDGTRHNVHNRHYSYNEYVEYDNYDQRQLKLAEKKIDKLLETVQQTGPENVRCKIVSRLWLSSTTGEAMVILREVLGNGIIPTLTKSDVKQLT